MSSIAHRLNAICMLFVCYVIVNVAVANERNELRVAIAQPAVQPGDVKGNVQRMRPLIAEAARQKAELVVFSECGITGYDLKGIGAAAAITLDHQALKSIADMSREYNVVVIAGFHERRDNALHNSAAVFYPDGKRIIQRKHLIFPPEKSICPVVSGPRERTLFDINGARLALLICSDAGIPKIFDELAEAGCDATVVITAGGGSTKLGMHQSELATPEGLDRYAKRAINVLSSFIISQCVRLDCGQIACNQMGWDDKIGYFHIGGSSIVDRTGEVTAVIPHRVVFEYQRPVVEVGSITIKSK